MPKETRKLHYITNGKERGWDREFAVRWGPHTGDYAAPADASATLDFGVFGQVHFTEEQLDDLIKTLTRAKNYVDKISIGDKLLSGSHRFEKLEAGSKLVALTGDRRGWIYIKTATGWIAQYESGQIGDHFKRIVQGVEFMVIYIPNNMDDPAGLAGLN